MQVKLFQVFYWLDWYSMRKPNFCSKRHTRLGMTPSIPFKAVTREIVDAIHTSGLLEVQVKLFLVF